jgi:hypothetical protein
MMSRPKKSVTKAPRSGLRLYRLAHIFAALQKQRAECERRAPRPARIRAQADRIEDIVWDVVGAPRPRKAS